MINGDGVYIVLAYAPFVAGSGITIKHNVEGLNENEIVNASIRTCHDEINLKLPKDTFTFDAIHDKSDYGIFLQRNEGKLEISYVFNEFLPCGPCGYSSIRDIEDELENPIFRLVILLMSLAIVEKNESSDDFKYWFEKASDLIKQGKLDESIEYFDKAIELNPSEALLWYMEGRVLIELNKCSEAIEILDKAFELNPSYINSLCSKGIAYEKLGEYNHAIDCYDKAMKLDSNNGYAYELRGTLHLIHLIDYNEAIKYLNQAIKINPENSMTWNNLGDAYLNLGEFEKALKCCDKAISLDSNNFRAWFTTGEIYYELQEYDKAMEYALKAKEINPNDSGLLSFIEKIKETKNKNGDVRIMENNTYELENLYNDKQDIVMFKVKKPYICGKTVEVEDGIFVDYDEENIPVAIKIHDARERFKSKEFSIPKLLRTYMNFPV